MAKITYKFPSDKFKQYIEIAKMESVTILSGGNPKKPNEPKPIQAGDVVIAQISFRDPASIGYMERLFAKMESSKKK